MSLGESTGSTRGTSGAVQVAEEFSPDFLVAIDDERTVETTEGEILAGETDGVQQ